MKSDNPLSIPESERSLKLSAALRRVGRIAWILVVNTLVAWLMFMRLRSVGFPALDFQLALSFQLWFEFAFEVILPVAGVFFEIANWKFAKWVNVGSFIAAGCFWLIAAIWNHSDPFFGVLLIMAIGLFLVGGLTELVYKMTRTD